jgi:predicted ATPase
MGIAQGATAFLDKPVCWINQIRIEACMLKKITLLRERVEDWTLYPFSVPAIASLPEIEIRSRIVFFAGENGSGKSTLLEAVAGHYGFGPEGGNRNLQHDTTEHNHSTDSLIRALRLSFDKRTGAGFFLRAESFFNTATTIDELEKQILGPRILPSYGGQSLHTRSHGETFFTLLERKFTRDGLFLLDEPEAALSPQRQLSFLILIHDTLRRFKDAQFIISTHSPVLLGYPGAQILSFDDGHLHPIAYEDTAPMQIVRRFLNNRETFLDELFHGHPSLFEERHD